LRRIALTSPVWCFRAKCYSLPTGAASKFTVKRPTAEKGREVSTLQAYPLRKDWLFVRLKVSPMILDELEREYLPMREQAFAVRRYL
jgi:hypothetical protein